MREAIRVAWQRLRSTTSHRSVEEALDEEMTTHLELLASRFINQGMSPGQARIAARRQFGGVTQLKESLRDSRSYPAIEWLLQDFAQALRQIRTAPRFMVSAATILALGIGAITAMFSVVNAALLRPLPYAAAERLVWIGEVLKRNTADEVTLTPNFLEWRRRSQVFSAMAAYNPVPRTLMTDDGVQPLNTVKASAALLPVLEANTLLGRPFLPNEDHKGQDRVAILSYGLWQQAFGGERAVIGRSIKLDDGSYQVVGVLPREFYFPTLPSIDLMTPLGKNEAAELTRAEGTTTVVRNVIARMKPGVTIERARGEMETIESNLAPPDFLSGVQMSVKVIPLQDRFVGDLRRGMLTLMCAAGCFLLLVCVNVASLLLGRGETRRKEIAIRAALGASRGRVIQQLLMESLVLALLGSGIGMVIAFGLRNLLLHLIPRTLPGPMTFPFDAQVLGFAFLCAITTALVFGIAPALSAVKADPSAALTSDGRTISGGARRQRWLNGLVSAQMAIAIVLLTGGGMMLRTLWNLRYRDLGFSTDRAVTATVHLNRARYRSAAQQTLFVDRVLERMRSVPGVEAAGFGILPPGEGYATNGFAIEGRGEPPQRRRPTARQYSASPGYFRMLGVALRSGREFEESDSPTALPVALVNEAFARSQFPGESPIGHRIRSEPNQPWRTIVGVVSNVSTAGLGKPAELAYFVPHRQAGLVGGEGAGFLVRGAIDTSSLASFIRKVVAELDPQQPLARIEMLEQRLNDSVRRPRLAAALLALFAALGLLLAATGLHSVMFVLVQSRFREIGVRLALGGRPRDIIMMILRSSLRVMLAGLLAGVCLAISLTQLLQSMWYGVSPTDPFTLAGSAAVLVLAGLAAVSQPAWQASRVDPMDVLRNE